MIPIELSELEGRARRLGWYFELFNSRVFLIRDGSDDPPWTFNGRLDNDYKSEFSQGAIKTALGLVFREEERRDTHI